MPFLYLFIVLVLGFAVPARADVNADMAAAKTVVSSFDDSLLSVMKNAKALGFQGRYDQLAPVIDRDFDSAFTTKLVVGSGWNNLSAAQQASLVDHFRKFTISTYANRFDGYNGEQIVITGPTQREEIRVQTQIVMTSGDPVKLDYILHRTAGGWQIIDIFLNGTISQLATQRSEFQAVLKSDGADGLIAMLDKKTADMASPAAAAK